MNTEGGGSTGPTNMSKESKDFVGVREVGGSMSPLWPSYYSPYKPVSPLGIALIISQ